MDRLKQNRNAVLCMKIARVAVSWRIRPKLGSEFENGMRQDESGKATESSAIVEEQAHSPDHYFAQDRATNLPGLRSEIAKHVRRTWILSSTPDLVESPSSRAVADCFRVRKAATESRPAVLDLCRPLDVARQCPTRLRRDLKPAGSK